VISESTPGDRPARRPRFGSRIRQTRAAANSSHPAEYCGYQYHPAFNPDHDYDFINYSDTLDLQIDIDGEQFSTLAGIREHLLQQLEDWLPETRLHWGEEVHLLPGNDDSARKDT
jgi:hypothetical protein